MISVYVILAAIVVAWPKNRCLANNLVMPEEAMKIVNCPNWNRMFGWKRPSQTKPIANFIEANATLSGHRSGFPADLKCLLGQRMGSFFGIQ